VRTLQNSAALPLNRKAGIRWGRVFAAAVLSEVAVIVVLLAVIGVHRLILPGLTADQYQEFGQVAGYYVAAPAAALATFAFAFWTARRVESAFIANGIWVGAMATLLSLGFIFGARPEDRWMYIVSYLARIAGGYCGGLVAQKRSGAIG